jgi:hypothetical protein
MSRDEQPGAIDVSVEIRIIDAVDGTPETGVTSATAGLALAFRRQLGVNTTFAAASLATLTTAHTDGGFLHIGNGYYRVDLPDAACDIGSKGVLIHGTVPGMVIIGEYIQLRSVATTADLETAVGDTLIDYRLDELAFGSAGVPGQPPADGSFMHLLMTKLTSGFTYNQTTDSLEAIRDRGDAAWITGAGGTLSDILTVEPLYPESVDLANTKPYRFSLMLMNAVDDLPTIAEIIPGTFSVERSAYGGTAWIPVVTDAPCLELPGLIYYDVIFSAAAGFAAGDSLRCTFKNQRITVAANDYEISDANGRTYYAEIRTPLPTALIGGRMPSDLEAINNSPGAAIALARAADSMQIGTVDTAGFAPTPTEFESDDITEATPDHFNGLTLKFTSGPLLKQGTAITDYSFVGGRGHFTVVALSEAPGNNDTFVIV